MHFKDTKRLYQASIESFQNINIINNNENLYAIRNSKNTIYQKWENLTEMNNAIINQILKSLKIKRKIQFSSELNVEGTGVTKIMNIIKAVGGDEYLSGMGKGSLRYIQGNERVFEENEIKLTFQKFAHPKYPQLHGEFVPNLSILDAIFNIGPEDTLKKLNQN